MLESDCDAPDRPPDSIEPPGPFVTIPAFFYSSSPCNNYFALLSSALWTLCKTRLFSLFPVSQPFLRQTQLRSPANTPFVPFAICKDK
jgi:hypothetical protein